MAAKQKPKTYTVNKRFDVWLTTEIVAPSFDAAVQEGRSLAFCDMRDCDVVDVTEIDGFGVQENW